MSLTCRRQPDCGNKAADGVYLCTQHTKAIATTALIAAARYSDFEALLLNNNAATYDNEKLTGSKAVVSGFNEYALDIRNEITAVLGVIAVSITVTRGLPSPGDYPPSELARVIAENANWVAAQPHAATASADLEEITRNPRYRLPEPGRSKPWPLVQDDTSMMCTEDCQAHLWYVTVNDDGYIICDSPDEQHSTRALEWLGAITKGV